MAEASDIAIVGAGPAGQIFRTGVRGLTYPGKDPRGDRLRASLRAQRGLIDYRPQSEIVGIEPDLSLWVHGPTGAVARLRPRAVVLATGALELWVPIPGWTLPGVYGLGGLQILLKTSGVVPRGP